LISLSLAQQYLPKHVFRFRIPGVRVRNFFKQIRRRVQIAALKSRNTSLIIGLIWRRGFLLRKTESEEEQCTNQQEEYVLN